MNSDSIVIIPTYNERENIAQMIDTVLALPQPFHLLIVDDGSPDGTAAIVREKQTEYPGAGTSPGALGQARARHSLHRWIPVVTTARLRVYLRDGL